MASVCNVTNASQSTRLLASTTLRTILGTKTLQEILADREHTAEIILSQLDQATDSWGIRYRAYIGSFRLRTHLQRSSSASWTRPQTPGVSGTELTLDPLD
jgi:erythrocyte band 7 integral membrane protein